MKKTFCGIRILAFLWIATLFFTLFTPLCSAATCAPRKVRVGYFTADQFQETDAAGLRSGYGYDYLQAIAQYANWEYDYVDASWAECLALLENGEIDLVGFMEKSPERERTYDFAAMQSGMDAACLFVPTSDTHYAFEDFPSFDGMTVGVTRGSMHAQTLAAYAAENGFSVTMVPYESEPLLLRALNENKVNSALMNRSVGAEGFRMIAELTSTPFYYATTKGNSALLKELNAAQKQIKSSNPYFDSELAARHFSSLSERTAVFTSAERNYITGHAAITALYDPLWFPLEFYNRDTDSYDGVMSDVFRSISASTGLTFEFETADSYHNVLERFQNGEGEILTALSYDYNWAATLNTSLTPSFIEVPAVAVLSSHSTNSTVVAMPRGYYLTEQLKKDNTHGSGFTIHYYDTIPECFDALLHGNAGSTIVNTYVANYFLHFPAYQNFTFRSVPGSTDRLCIGVSKNSDPLLLSIISKAVSNISHAEMQGILGKYTNYSQKITPVDILYSDPALVISGLIVVLIVLFTSVMLFVSNHISHRKNVQLERANAAKTDFLARMSHEMRTPLSAIIGLNNLAQEQISDPEALENSLHQVDISSHHLLQLINDVLDMTKISEGKMVMRLAPFDLLSTVEIVRTVYGPTAEQRQLSFAVDTTKLKQSCVCGDELRLRQVVIKLIY
ncbi:MAG: transporter substrate-binding domain-containing protein, partial [Pygmaiobacter sp.]